MRSTCVPTSLFLLQKRLNPRRHLTMHRVHRAAQDAHALNALSLQRLRDQTSAPQKNVWRVLDNKAALNAGKVDEASCPNPAGEKVPNKTDAGESKAVAVHLKGRSMSDIEGSQLVLSIEDIR